MPTEEDWHSHIPMDVSTFKLQTSIPELYSQIVTIDIASQSGVSSVVGDVHHQNGSPSRLLTLDGLVMQDGEYIKLCLLARNPVEQKPSYLLVMDQIGNKTSGIGGLYSGKVYQLSDELAQSKPTSASDFAVLEQLAKKQIPAGKKISTFGGSLQRYH